MKLVQSNYDGTSTIYDYTDSYALCIHFSVPYGSGPGRSNIDSGF